MNGSSRKGMVMRSPLDEGGRRCPRFRFVLSLITRSKAGKCCREVRKGRKRRCRSALRARIFRATKRSSGKRRETDVCKIRVGSNFTADKEGKLTVTHLDFIVAINIILSTVKAVKERNTQWLRFLASTSVLPTPRWRLWRARSLRSRERRRRSHHPVRRGLPQRRRACRRQGREEPGGHQP